MSAKEELGRFTLDELFGEIKHRGEAGVLILVTRKSPADRPLTVRMFGGAAHCIGLTQVATAILLKNLLERKIRHE